MSKQQFVEQLQVVQEQDMIKLIESYCIMAKEDILPFIKNLRQRKEKGKIGKHRPFDVETFSQLKEEVLAFLLEKKIYNEGQQVISFAEEMKMLRGKYFEIITQKIASFLDSEEIKSAVRKFAISGIYFVHLKINFPHDKDWYIKIPRRDKIKVIIYLVRYYLGIDATVDFTQIYDVLHTENFLPQIKPPRFCSNCGTKICQEGEQPNDDIDLDGICIYFNCVID